MALKRRNADVTSQVENVDEQEKKLNKKLLKAVLMLILKIAVAGAIGIAVWLFVGEVHILHDNNMYPHVKDGSLVVSYKIGDVIKGNVVMYELDGEMRLGRVIGTAGDVIDMDGSGEYTVNGIPVYENVFYPTYPAGDEMEYPLTVGEDSYFIMNDYRENAEDSRMFGCIVNEKIHGRIVLMFQHRDI